jgi:hypothetical protein
MLRRAWAGLWAAVCLFSAVEIFSQAEEEAGEAAVPDTMPAASGATTIPEALRRPRRGEAGRYPVDTIIGPLGVGEAGEDAYRFAGELLRALVSGNRGAPALSTIESGALDKILEDLQVINPASCRLGGGRKEADGAVSFLVRFIGREKGIAGELYIRADDDGTAAEDEPAEEIPPAPEDERPEDGAGSLAADEGGKDAGKAVVWRFDDLVLEDPGDRGAPAEEGRFDFVPYERFF